MSNPAWGEALGTALLGRPLRMSCSATPSLDDVLAALAADGVSADDLVTHARDVRDAGGVWPHPVPPELTRPVGAAAFLSLLKALRAQLGLTGTVARPPAVPRPLTPDERRLLADKPPHHGS